MPKEIERKFLVKDSSWKTLAEPEYYKQGYLSYGKGNTVRVRIAGRKAFLTVKSSTVGISRSEFEYNIPLEEAKQILEEICEKPLIEKHRTKIEYKGMVWEVDEFLSENKGLVIAEIELESEDQQFELPPWIGKEVSGDKRYYNSYLIKNPFCTWQ